MAANDRSIGEIRALTGIRGVAAMIVFLSHARDTLASRGLHFAVPLPVERLFFMGGRQVDVFFVLSGFILTLIYQSWFRESVGAGPYREFLQRRFARIYPLHAAILLLVIAFVLAAEVGHANVLHGTGRFTWSQLPAYFLLIHAWGPLGPEGGTWNPPSWSISIEAFCYLVFPFLIYLIATANPRRYWTTLVCVAIAGFAANSVLFWGQAGIPGLTRGLTEFLLGCATVQVFNTSLADWLRRDLGSLLAFAGLVVCYLLTPDTGFVIALCAAPLLLSLSGSNIASRMFAWLPIYFLGEISYSVYLGHFLFSSVAYRFISVPWMKESSLHALAGAAFIIAFVLACATATYYLIERPGRRLLRGKKPRPAVVTQVPVV
ncbi:MAG: acyltransferase [Steroidobacteraceae bacterium]